MKKIAAHIGTFMGIIGLLWLVLFLAACIPNALVCDNMEKSALTYKDKEPYEMTDGKKLNAIQDNYADAILLGVTWNMGSGNPFVASLDTKYYDGGEQGEALGLYKSLYGMPANVDYSRYWHGSAAVIRPLLLVTDVAGIRTIGFAVVIVLALLIGVLFIRRKMVPTALFFWLSLILVQVWNVRLAMEYMPAFLVALFMCILFIKFEKEGDTALTILSVVSGVMIAFFDFLTTETLTILLPLIFVYMIRAKENRLEPTKKNIICIVKCIAAWGVSYGMTFVVKWIAASAVTGSNKIAAAVSSAEVRVNGNVDTENISVVKQFLYAVPANLSTMFGGEERVDVGKIILGLVLYLLIAGSIFYLFRAKMRNHEIAVVLLVLGAVPYIRYMILNNHSYLHEFFTYRAQCSSIVALFGIIWFNIDNPFSKWIRHSKVTKGTKTRRRTKRRTRHGGKK